MKKIVNFIVEKRKLMLILFIVIAIVCIFLSGKVNINYDISKYLSKDSQTRQGLDIMEEEFKEDSSSFNLMFEGLNNDEKNTIYEELTEVENVKSIDYNNTEEFNKDNYTLYKITVNGDVDSTTASETYKTIVDKYKNYNIKTNGDVDTRNKDVLPIYILVAAVICGTIILIIMSDSIVEVFLFLFTILVAVLLNKGTNIIFPNVSNITDSISAILQLALSMDYSIILMNRYRQEQAKNSNKTEAMKEALYKSISSVSSSSITTIVGLLALVFMSFTIGKDLGLVLAKGVLCSLISTIFVLPGLILIFDKWIEKTKKKTFSLKFDKLGNFSYKFRIPFLIIFIVLFIAGFLLKGNLGIYFVDNNEDDISKIFPKTNQFAIIYNNKDEEKVCQYAKELEQNEKIDAVVCYENIMHEKMTFYEIGHKLEDLGIPSDIKDNMLKLVFYMKSAAGTNDENWAISMEELINFINANIINDSKFDAYLEAGMKEEIIKYEAVIEQYKNQLVGNNYSRIIVTSKMETEGEDVKNVVSQIKDNLNGTEFYIVGDSPMAIEMSDTFSHELNIITILTIVFIFIVVAISFKSFIIPTVLVLIIQCAVYATMSILSLVGGNVYFISLLIVQAVLMGATIDYGIVYTTYYLENRKNFDPKQAIIESYNKSIHTILTSSLILTICTLVVAIFTSAAASRICETISEGTICATLLIVFVLPGVLAALNKVFKVK